MNERTRFKRSGYEFFIIHTCVCVCERERERERESQGLEHTCGCPFFPTNSKKGKKALGAIQSAIRLLAMHVHIKRAGDRRYAVSWVCPEFLHANSATGKWPRIGAWHSAFVTPSEGPPSTVAT